MGHSRVCRSVDVLVVVGLVQDVPHRFPVLTELEADVVDAETV